MAHNSFIRAGGVWNNGSAVTSAEFAAFDLAQFKSGNLDDGGTWAPAAAIVIGGLGINVTGPALLGAIGTSSLTGTLTVASGGTISLAAGSFFTGTTRMTALTVTTGSAIVINTGSTVDCASPAVFTGAFTSNGASAFGGAVTCTSTFTLNTTADIVLGSVSVNRLQNGTPFFNPTNWAPLTGGSQVGSFSNLVINTRIALPLDLPTGCTLTGVDVYVTAASGHAGVPANMPAFSLYNVVRSGSTATVGTVTDGSASTAAFEVNHAISLSGLSEAVTRTSLGSRYIVEFTAEAGANALVGLKVTGWTATYTVTKYDRGVG